MRRKGGAMDREHLVDLIVARVQQKIGEYQKESSNAPTVEERKGAQDKKELPGLLILSQHSIEGCKSLTDHPQLNQHFQISMKKAETREMSLSGVEVLLLLDLDNAELTRIAEGFCDTPYAALVMKAFLGGKKVYVPHDQIELFSYRQTAPAAYYGMLRDKLSFLENCGLKICDSEHLAESLLGSCGCAADTENACTCRCAEKASSAHCSCESKPCAWEEKTASPITGACACGKDKERTGACGYEEKHKSAEKSAIESEGSQETRQDGRTIMIDKRVITERDIIEAERERITTIHLRRKNLITDLAKEAAAARNITLIRD